MKRILAGLSLWPLGAIAQAQKAATPPPSTTNITTDFIYGFVILVFVIGFVLVWLIQKKEGKNAAENPPQEKK
jgi:hypothetical protein